MAKKLSQMTATERLAWWQQQEDKKTARADTLDADLNAFSQSVSSIGGWQDPDTMARYISWADEMGNRVNALKRYSGGVNMGVTVTPNAYIKNDSVNSKDGRDGISEMSQAAFDYTGYNNINGVLSWLEKTKADLEERSSVYAGYDSSEAYEAARTDYEYHSGLSADELRGKMNTRKQEREDRSSFLDTTRLSKTVDALSSWKNIPNIPAMINKSTEIKDEIVDLSDPYNDEEYSKLAYYYYQKLMEQAKGYTSGTKKEFSLKFDKNEMFDYAIRADADEIEMIKNIIKVNGGELDIEKTGYRNLTDDEKSLYLWLYDNEGADAAAEYYNYLYNVHNQYNRALTDREGERASGEKNDFQKVVSSFSGGLENWWTGNVRAVKSFVGEDVPTTVNEYEMQYDRSSLDGAAGVMYDLGSTFGQMAPSVLAGALTGGGSVATSVATFGVSIYGNAYHEARELGADHSKAMTYSALTAASEVALQNLIGGIPGVGKHLTGKGIASLANKTSNVMLKLAAELGGDVLGEAFEEGLQEAIGVALRQFVLETDEDVENLGQDIMYSAMLGALSSLGLGGASSVGQYVGYRNTGKFYNTGFPGAVDGSRITGIDLIEEGLAGSTDSEAYKMAEQLSKREESGKKATNAQLGYLASKIDEDAKTERMPNDFSIKGNEGLIRDTVSNFNARLNPKVQLSEDAVADKAQTPDERMAIAKEIARVSAESGLTEDGLAAPMYAAGLDPAVQSEKTSALPTENAAKNENAVESLKTGRETVKSTGEESSTGKQVTAKEDATKEADDGSAAYSREAVYADESKKLSAAARTVKGSNLAKAYQAENEGVSSKERQNADVYIADYKRVRNIASGGHSIDAVRAMGVGESLSEAQFTAAYNEGYALAQKNSSTVGGTVRKSGKVYFNGTQGVKRKNSSMYLPASGLTENWRSNYSLSEDQRAALDFAERVLAPMGVDVVFYSSARNRSLPNGMYAEGRIYIDIEAGMTDRTKQTYVTYAIAHEVTHLSEKMSPELWCKYADAVVEVLAKEEGISVSELIAKYQLEQEQSEIERLRRVYPDKKDDVAFLRSKAKKLDEKGAIREIVADASQLILTRESRFLEKLKAKDVGLCKKIIALAKEAIRNMKKALQNLRAPRDAVSAAVEKHLDKLVGYFDEMMADTLDKAGRATVKDGVVQFQERDFSESVDLILDNKFPRGNYVRVTKTPEFYTKIGLNPNLPMLTTATHIYSACQSKNRDFHEHGLTPEQMKKVPAELESPVMVMDAIDRDGNIIPDNIIVVTGMVDPDKVPVIIPIKVNDKAQYNGIEVDTNILKSFYGKESFKNFIKRHLEADAILYINKDKATQLSTESSAQWLEQLKACSFGTIIHKSRAIVKPFDTKNYFNNSDDGQFQHRRVGEEDRQVLARAAKSLARSDADNKIVKSYFGKLEEYRAKQKELNGIADRLEKDNWGEVKLESSERYALLQKQDTLQKELETADSSLLEMEAMAPLRNLVERERQKAASAATEVANVKQTAQLREEKKQARELRVKYLARAERAVSRIYKWATHPTKKDHVPTALMPLVKQLFEAVDVSHHFAQIERLEEQLAQVEIRLRELREGASSPSVIAAQEALRSDLIGRIRKLEGISHNLTWDVRLKNLQEVMSTVENAPDFNIEFCAKLYDDIAAQISKLKTDGRNRLFEATPELLRTYAEALESISHSITEAGRLYANKRAANTETLAEQSIREFQAEKREAAKTNATAGLRRMFNMDSLNPAYFAKKMGHSTEAVMNELFEGYYQTIANVRVVDDFLDGIREKYKVSAFTGKNEKLHSVKLERGGSVTLTTSQIMTLYALSDRPQAKKHLYGRGLQSFRGNIREAVKKIQPWWERLGDEFKRMFGKDTADLSEFAKQLFGGSDVKSVTEKDVEEMIGLLTADQKDCVREMKKFLRDVIAPMGNKTSQTLYLYDMFTEENYFPIESVGSFIRLTEKDQKDNGLASRSVFSLLNKGFTKNLQEQAGNPIVIRDVFDVFTDHCFDMANYGGLGVAVSDTIRWLNYKQPGQNPFISEDSSDQRRYELLKNRSIPLSAIVQTKKIREAEEKLDVSVEQLSSSIKYSEKRTIVKKIAEEFGVFKDYENADIDMSFQFSRERFREGFNKQTAEYRNYVMMLSCFDEIIKNAIGVEAHNRNGKYKTDVSLNKVYVLVSAFVNGNDIIPVKLEVKEFLDKKNSLHVAIALESIKKDEVVMEGNTENGVTQATRSSDISISQLLSKINPKDKSFIKYIPDGFLDSERSEVKRKALEEDAKKEQKERSADKVAEKTPEQDGTTVREEMEKAWGSGAEAYIKNLLRSIEGELKGTDGAKVINKLIRNAKIAAVAANLRVAALQPTAYTRAAVVISPRAMLGSLGHLSDTKKMIEEATEHSELMWYKRQGFYDMNNSRSLLEKLKDGRDNEKTKWDKVKGTFKNPDRMREAATWLAGFMDELTWGTLWRACRYDIDLQIREKGLAVKKNSTEYFALVRDRFHEVINFTQVIDSPMHKNKLMSDPDTGMKQLTAFMAEPMLTLNMMHSAADDAIRHREGGRMKLFRATMTFTASVVFQAVLAGLVDAARDNDDDEGWLEKYGEAVFRNITGFDMDDPSLGGVLAGDWNIFNNVPILKEVFSLMEGYDPSRMDLSGIVKMMQAANKVVRLLSDTDDMSFEKFEKTMYSLMQAVSTVTGISVSNLWRTVRSLINTAKAWIEQFN